MAAVIGLSKEKVQAIVDSFAEDGVLAVANHNTAEQIVITGEQEPVSRAIQAAKKEGAKAIPLRVSGAWHCSLMQRAVGEFRAYMEQIPFSPPTATMLFNATGATETNPEAMKDIMAKQLVSAVKWYDIVGKMLAEGVDTFVEVGPKKVLTGLVGKIVPKGSAVQLHQVADMSSLERFLNRGN
jgi:[acyl-carrier-protein] S-malonyltransferase